MANQPRRTASAVWDAVPYPMNSSGPRTRTSPRRPGGTRRVVPGTATRISASPTEWPSVSRACSGVSRQLLVVTVGASVEP